VNKTSLPRLRSPASTAIPFDVSLVWEFFLEKGATKSHRAVEAKGALVSDFQPRLSWFGQ
jgi:hypothetical protein